MKKLDKNGNEIIELPNRVGVERTPGGTQVTLIGLDQLSGIQAGKIHIGSHHGCAYNNCNGGCRGAEITQKTKDK